MTDTPILRSDFYVYALFREDGITPFYIGKGRGQRIVVHERSAHRFTSHKDHIIRNMMAAGIKEIPKAKLIEGLLDDDAKQIEMDLIQLIGRWPTGPLANLTSGGDGVSSLAPASRARKSAANKIAWDDPVVRAKRSAGISRAWTPERRNRQSQERADQSKRAEKEKLANERQDRRAAQRAAAARIKEDAARERQSPEAKAARAEKSRQRIYRLYSDPATKAARVAAQKNAFSTPEAKAKRSAASKKMWAAKKARENQYALPSENDADPAQPPPQQP